MPSFRLAAMVSLALLLFVVTMASQNLPGVAAILRRWLTRMPISADHAHRRGYAAITPFGAYALSLSAITAAICIRPDEDPDKRYTAAVSCSAIYVVIGLFGAAVTGVLTAFPKRTGGGGGAGPALLVQHRPGLAVAVKDENAPRGGASPSSRSLATSARPGAWWRGAGARGAASASLLPGCLKKSPGRRRLGALAGRTERLDLCAGARDVG